MRRIPPADCPRACEWISLRLDAQLSDFEAVLLEAHLAGCHDCRAFAESAAGLTEMLRAAPLEEAPSGFRLPRKSRSRLHSLRVVSAAAIVGVLGLSGLVSLELSSGRSPSAASRLTREVIGLKERQLDQIDNAGRSPVIVVPTGLAAAEQVTVAGATDLGARLVITPAIPAVRRTDDGRK